MEIEHINDGTIRVKIENSDLINRGITFLDLLSNEKQIEQFFYSILEEVDLNDDFKDSDAVTFQVMPKDNGLELYISKGANFDENIIQQFMNQQEKSESKADESSKDEGSYDYGGAFFNAAADATFDKMITFENIERVILLAQDIDTDWIDSKLYHQGSHYYLQLSAKEDPNVEFLSEEYFDLLMAKVLDYGEESRISIDVLDEYGQCVIDMNALDVLKAHFK